MKVVIVGVGALGSHLILLTRNLKAQFVLVDMDKIETKNTMSQFHTRMGVGKNKAVATQQTLSGLFGLKVEANPNRLTADNVRQILGGADLVVDCLDNAASRQVVQDFVRANKIPCLHGALDPDGSFGRVVWDEVFVIDHEGTVGAATCEDGRHLPFIVWASSLLAYATQQFVEKGIRVNFQGNPRVSTTF
jgi:predicted ThiF/HesA family dinucleotide-utilizing enzyme